MTIHWAKTLNDNEQVICQGYTVGEVLVETDDDVSSDLDSFRGYPDACVDCKVKLEIEYDRR